MVPAAKDIDVPRERDRDGVVAALRDQLDRYRRHQAREAGWRRRVVATGLALLDEVLPEGGIPCGTITEILAEGPGVGAMSLAMRVAGRTIRPAEVPPLPGLGDLHGTHTHGLRRGLHERAPSCDPLESGRSRRLQPAAQEWRTFVHGHLDTYAAKRRGSASADEWIDDGRAIVLIDTLGDFYPPAALQQGINLERLVVLRVSDEREAFWAADQALRCPAVAAVIASFRRLDERSSRRLQLAAESSGCMGLMLMPAVRRGKSFAAVQMLVESASAKYVTSSCGGWDSPYALWLPHGRGSVPCRFAAEPVSTKSGALRRFLLRITLLKVREGMPVGPVVVDLDHETGTVSLLSLPIDRPVTQTG